MPRTPSLTTRLSAPLTFGGGLLWAVGGSTALSADDLGIAMTVPHILLSVGGLLTLVGLRELANLHAGRIGPAGITGAVLTGAGVMLVVASKNVPAGISDDTAWNLFVMGGSLLVVGALLFGIIILGAGTSWLLGGPLLAIGVLGVFNLTLMMVSMEGAETVEKVLLPILIGLAWTALGYGLWSHEAGRSDRPRLMRVDSAGAGAGPEAEVPPARKAREVSRN